MKCICKQSCYIKHDDVNTRFNPGQVADFKTCPTHFVSCDSASIDFLTASEDELMNTKWKRSDAETAMTAYGVELTGADKGELVKHILDIRERSVSDDTSTPAE